jgi:hypothetical protein
MAGVKYQCSSIVKVVSLHAVLINTAGLQWCKPTETRGMCGMLMGGGVVQFFFTPGS